MFQNPSSRSKTGIAAFIAVGAASLAGCAMTPSDRTPVWMGQLSQGAPVLGAKPASWKTLKFEDIIRQQADFSCGAAAMATILNFAYGYETTERQVLVNMLKVADPDLVRQKGFSLLDMKTYAQIIGLSAEGYRVDYDTLAQIEIPAIVLIDVRGYKHFVIVRRMFGNNVAIGDPALGNRTLSRNEFEQAWNGIAFIVMGEGYDPQNVLLDPPSPLSARQLLATSASLPAAQAAEFGFSPGYDFTF